MRINVPGIHGVLDVITKFIVLHPAMSAPGAHCIDVEVHQAKDPFTYTISDKQHLVSVAQFIVFVHPIKTRTRRSRAWRRSKVH